MLLFDKSGNHLWSYSRGQGIDDSSIAEAGKTPIHIRGGFNGEAESSFSIARKRDWNKAESKVGMSNRWNVDSDGSSEIIATRKRAANYCVRTKRWTSKNRYLAGSYVAHFP